MHASLSAVAPSGQGAVDFQEALMRAPVAILATGPDGRVAFVNDELVRLTGWAREAIIGRRAEDVVPGPTAWRRADGAVFPATIRRSAVLLDAGGWTVWSIVDDTERERTEADLFFRATHDPLTGLANRSLLMDRVRQAIGRLERQGPPLAVLFVDLDRFKEVNDTRGHHAGDGMLRAVASAIAEAVRPSDTVARVGGDEFVVVCEGVSGSAAALELAERVRESVNDATADALGSGAGLSVTASVGVALAAGEAPPGWLVDVADHAMYDAKRAGGDRVVVTTWP
ncbi:MAG TPA: sensor domain-containing diguanylate cyclase [Acidimicrobiales bacterium]